MLLFLAYMGNMANVPCLFYSTTGIYLSGSHLLTKEWWYVSLSSPGTVDLAEVAM